MLRIESLVVRQGTHELHYHLQIKEKEIVALQGRSGVGKTTLLMTIAGFLPATKGDILWQGRSLLSLPVEQRPITMLFQDYNLFEHLSVEQNLMLGFSGAIPVEELRTACTRLEVLDQWHKKPPQLSGGQRQRIALIRCLLRTEPLCLLDEPFAELDDHSRQLCLDWCREIIHKQGKTVLLVTHQQDDVRQLADRRITLDPPASIALGSE